MKKKLEIYCVTNKDLNFLRNLNYNLAAVGKNKFPKYYTEWSWMTEWNTE